MGIITNDKFLVKKNITILPKLENLIEFEKPKYIEEEYGGKTYRDFYNSHNYFFIENSGMLNIYNNYDYSIIITHLLKNGEFIYDGLLIGIDRGEFGGELCFRHCNNRIIDEAIILNDSIKYIFNYNENIYVLSGLGHLSTDYGKINILKYHKNKIVILKEIDIFSEPQVYNIYNNQLIIITHKYLIIIENEKMIKKIRIDEWDALGVFSLYINEKSFFIGAKGCLFVIDKNNYKIKLYKQKNGA
jgi:hypothetical protein